MPGSPGQVGNCQTVVFAAYVTARAHALFGFRLYLPKSWCGDRERRERAHVPPGTQFTTKPALGTAMITDAVAVRASRSPGRQATKCTAAAPSFGQACENAGKGYVLAVPVNFTVTRHPAARRPWPP